MSPEYLDSVCAIVSKNGDRLQSLIGKRLSKVWLAWDVESDCWYADEPVVIQFEETSLAIVFWKSHEVALAWNAVDLTTPPAWFGSWEDCELAWRECKREDIQASIGKAVEDVILIENCETLQQIVENRKNWYPFGISFHFGSNVLTVFNALDENGICDNIPTADYLRSTSLEDLIKQ